MKSARQMIDERLTIQEGFHKGARIKISEAIAIELIEELLSELRQCKKEMKKILKNIEK